MQCRLYGHAIRPVDLARLTIGINLLSASGGYLADQLGWIPFFLIATLACLPGLGLLLWIMRREAALGTARAA